MKLISAHVTSFKNIVDSTVVEIQPDITCIVGKNESGKSAFLNAIYQSGPANPSAKFNIQTQYPAWLEKRHRREGIKLEDVQPVKLLFKLDPHERELIDARFGPETLPKDTVGIVRSYDNKDTYIFDRNEDKALAHIVANPKISAETREGIRDVKTLAALKEYIGRLQADKGEAATQAASSLQESINTVMGDKTELGQSILTELMKMRPTLLYFDEYSSLPGTIPIRELLAKDKSVLTEEERTSTALLNLAGTEDDYLLNADYEIRKRELENTATALTQDVLRYWTTNPELRVQIDLTQRTVPANPPQAGSQTVLDELKIRLWDDRHFLSLPFDQRSTGFRWFFSFMAAFSEYEHGNNPLVILLDEPGLGLHARAQKDFLAFIEERLAARCQVIYSTHSPFLVDPSHLERVRLVEDRGRDKGSIVTADILATDSDTIFPLQGALGYDLAQHLFIGQHNLLVEGTSDYTYFSVVSDHLKGLGREGLDERWSIIPIGGADLIPSFVALLGHHLELTVILDSRKEGNQRLARMVDDKLLQRNRLITIGELVSQKLADTEDLFSLDDYVALYNRTFKSAITATQLTGDDGVVTRIARVLGFPRFDHGRPADEFLRHRDEIIPGLKEDTLAQFQALFAKVNATLPK